MIENVAMRKNDGKLPMSYITTFHPTVLEYLTKVFPLHDFSQIPQGGDKSISRQIIMISRGVQACFDDTGGVIHKIGQALQEAVVFCQERTNQNTETEFISSWILEEVVKVCEYGAVSGKYAMHNWRLGMTFKTSVDCAMRHLKAFYTGEVIDGGVLDDESKCHHLGHYIWNLCVWLHMAILHPELNDFTYPEIN